jgi:hypothetical protein
MPQDREASCATELGTDTMPQLKTLQRWDLIGMSLIAVLGIVLVFLLDTGSVAEWIARHKHTKIDEIVFTALALMIVLWLFSARKWCVTPAGTELPAHRGHGRCF